MPELSPETHKRIGERLRSLRLLVGLTQTDLGLSLGVTKQMVSKYEAGSARLSSTALLEACRALGVSVSRFMQGVEPVIAEDAERTALLREVSRTFPLLFIEDQRLLLRYVQQLLKGDKYAKIYLPDRLDGRVQEGAGGEPDPGADDLWPYGVDP